MLSSSSSQSPAGPTLATSITAAASGNSTHCLASSYVPPNVQLLYVPQNLNSNNSNSSEQQRSYLHTSLSDLRRSTTSLNQQSIHHIHHSHQQQQQSNQSAAYLSPSSIFTSSLSHSRNNNNSQPVNATSNMRASSISGSCADAMSSSSASSQCYLNSNNSNSINSGVQQQQRPFSNRVHDNFTRLWIDQQNRQELLRRQQIPRRNDSEFSRLRMESMQQQQQQQQQQRYGSNTNNNDYMSSSGGQGQQASPAAVQASVSISSASGAQTTNLAQMQSNSVLNGDFGVQHITIPGMQISIGPAHVNLINHPHLHHSSTSSANSSGCAHAHHSTAATNALGSSSSSTSSLLANTQNASSMASVNVNLSNSNTNHHSQQHLLSFSPLSSAVQAQTNVANFPGGIFTASPAAAAAATSLLSTSARAEQLAMAALAGANVAIRYATHMQQFNSNVYNQSLHQQPQQQQQLSGRHYGHSQHFHSNQGGSAAASMSSSNAHLLHHQLPVVRELNSSSIGGRQYNASLAAAHHQHHHQHHSPYHHHHSNQHQMEMTATSRQMSSSPQVVSHPFAITSQGLIPFPSIFSLPIPNSSDQRQRGIPRIQFLDRTLEVRSRKCVYVSSIE
jgi:hypothetical protein